jgi:hypothetical protein
VTKKRQKQTKSLEGEVTKYARACFRVAKFSLIAYIDLIDLIDFTIWMGSSTPQSSGDARLRFSPEISLSDVGKTSLAMGCRASRGTRDPNHCDLVSTGLHKAIEVHRVALGLRGHAGNSFPLPSRVLREHPLPVSQSSDAARFN